jgi:hypothetical protein
VSYDEGHITEVSDPRALTIDEPATQAVEEIKVVKVRPPPRNSPRWWRC